MGWITNNWEKIFTICISVIVAGIIGYYSGMLRVQSKINELDKRRINEIHKLNIKIIEQREEIEKGLNNFDKEISKRINDIEKQLHTVKTDIDILVKPKLDQLDKNNERIFEVNNELIEVKTRTEDISLIREELIKFRVKSKLTDNKKQKKDITQR